ncbi:MAG: hypothetical protein ACKOPO_08730 [Novosphingobium sp.]
MERQGEEIHVTPTEARAGKTGTHLRNMLFVSLFLAIAIMSLLWISGALSAPQDHNRDDITNQASPTPAP